MSRSPEQVAPIYILGVPVAPVTMDEAVDWVDVAVRERRRLRVGVVNAAKIVNMRRDPELRDDVLSSDIILADGMSVVWASRLLGCPLPERVAGIDLMFRILMRGQAPGYRIYLLGAAQDVVEAATAHVRARYPGIEIVGHHHGYFAGSEEAAVASAICSARPDVLFVGMTSPRKERFLADWGERLGVPVCHGVGGSFDVLAGKVERAPERWQRLGLEWLYRVKQEPRRLWRRYLVTNSVFLGLVLRDLARRAAGRHRAGA
jgi:N-acetylglucosaminyldiphosphoundecaprenol N-acetyl-beta-D-mannosaminyltransferase